MNNKINDMPMIGATYLFRSGLQGLAAFPVASTGCGYRSLVPPSIKCLGKGKNVSVLDSLLLLVTM